MVGVCEPCGKHALLLQSHVLPAFVFKWLKRDGHIRYAETPNRRSQDGHKRDWLCRECEDLFNSFETPFAGQIFHPNDLALQLPCFEMGALSDRLVSSTPERPCDDVCGLDPLSSESDGDAADFLD